MTTTGDIFTNQQVAGTNENRDERAQRAVKAFRAMQPGLSGYARAITGKKNVRVELAQGVPRTDGTKIYFKPPIALGDLTPHARGLCELRDRSTRALKCPACRVREEVLITIYHEIAHIVFGTFEKTTSKAKVEAVERAIVEYGTAYATKIKAAMDALPDHRKADYLNLSGFISPFLPILVNALEDARVDSEMFKARKGTKVMFDAYVQQIFAQGIEGDDGTMSSWADRALNSQALIGVFVLACEYNYTGWFDPKIEEALGDSRLRELVRRIDTARSAHATYQLAFPILARLRELGYCKSDQDPVNDPDEEVQKPEPTPEDEEQDETDSAPGDAGQSEPDEGDGLEGPEAPADDEAQDAGDSDGDAEDGDGDSDTGGDEPSDEPAGSSPVPGEAGSGGGEDSDEVSDDAESGDDEEDPSSSSGGADGGADESESDATSESDPSDTEGDAAGDDQSEDGESSGSGSDGEAGGADTRAGDEARSGEGSPEPDRDVDGGPREDSQVRREDDLADGTDEASDSDGAGDGLDAEPSSTGDSEQDEEKSDSSRGEAGGPDREPGDSRDLLTEEDADPIDTGADDGTGGRDDKSDYDYGTHEGVAEDVQVFGKHEVPIAVEPSVEEKADEAAINTAIVQGQYFEKPSVNVSGVREHKYGQPIMAGSDNLSAAWIEDTYETEYMRKRYGISADTQVGEDVLGPALQDMRRAFADNARADHQRHLKSGKVNGRVLGKRAWAGDPRLFQKKRLPGRKSYSVLIGIDISGSTMGLNIALAKRAAKAQAELCHRAGIEFAVYAHTANGSWTRMSGYGRSLVMDIYEIKAFDEPWNDTAQEALDKIGANAENLDGHTIEYYRKAIERQNTTDKIILYYSDGKMPAANHDEELEILQREIAYCKTHSITLLGVGIRTDSPRRHGLDTVQVDDDSDLPKVIRHLETALLHNR